MLENETKIGKQRQTQATATGDEEKKRLEKKRLNMAHYKRDAASNRDALFGGSGTGSSSRTEAPKRAVAARPPTAASSPSRPEIVGTGSAASTFASNSSITGTADPNITPGPSSIFASSGRVAARNAPTSLLTGQAKITKMAEAEDYRLKAKKAMTRGVFSKPDPISAANFYKRAADAYKVRLPLTIAKTKSCVM